MLLKAFSNLPAPVRKLLRRLTPDRVAHAVFDKHDFELSYQIRWAKRFRERPEVVREYWERYRHLAEIERVCELGEQARILDVGCGVGTVLHLLPGERHGIDPLGDRYREIYDYPDGISVQAAPGEAIPFPDSHFDAVFNSNVLDHVTSPEQVLAEIHRVLRPEGHFVFTVELFPEQQERDPAHPHSLTREDVDSLLADRFEVVFEAESPWIGMGNYLDGQREEAQRRELIRVMQPA
ncbi:class I SAM-dependent methyltransferase [bacterium]|nr:class I SAM-dependent methyltransferase [bacterium]